MTKLVRATALALALCVGLDGGAQALDPLIKEKGIPGGFSANVALTSEYIFRGISQTDGVPALQGGFDYELGVAKDAKAYLGVWGSNVNFTDATLETDIYGGVKFGIGKLELDAGFIYYLYPGANSSLDYDFVEAKFAASYDAGFASATAGMNYSPEYFGKSGDAFYYALDVEVPVANKIAFKGHVGYQTIDNNVAFGTDDYLDYSIGATVNIAGFDLTLAWTDTDLSTAQCNDLCGIFTVTLSRSF